MHQVEVRIKGQINKSWSGWLAALTIAHTDGGETILSGTVRDQAALYGLLFQISNLGLELVSLSSAMGKNINADKGE